MRRVLRPAFVVVIAFLFVQAVAAQPPALPVLTSPVPKGTGAVPDPQLDDQKFGANAISATSYAFSSATGVPLEDMTTGTTQLVGPFQDDTSSPLTNFGFDFWYDGVVYTQFAVNANGLIRLAGIPSANAYDNSAEFASTLDSPKIASFWDDLCTSVTGKVHYKLVGSAPSRRLVIEWLNMGNYSNAQSGCTAAGSNVFQTWIYESTGAIQFVYAAITPPTDSGGYTVGLQSGSATNFASVTTADSTVSYTTANNSQLTPIADSTSYTFAPNIPASPTSLIFAGTTPFSTTLLWNDNAINEIGYLIYRSTDGTNYSLLTQLAADTNSYTDLAVFQSTTYFYRVFALTEGAVSASPASGNVTTPAAATITAAAGGGNWSSTSTWVGGAVPTASNNVVVPSGATVTIDTVAEAYALTVSGILQFDAATPRTLTLKADVTISNTGTLRSATSGTVTTHQLSIGRNLTNNGTLDLATNGNTAGAQLFFTGSANATWSGTGLTNDVLAITTAKTPTFSTTVEMTTTNFTVQGVATDVAGFLTIQGGTFKLSGSFPGTNRVFTPAAYTIPNAGGFWLNNPNYTVVGQAGGVNTFLNGLLRISQGTFNAGTTANDLLRVNANGAAVTVEGGTLNVSGAFYDPFTSTYTQTGGTVNVATVGNNLAGVPSFYMNNANSTFAMSGGTINLINRNISAGPADYQVSVNNVLITGGQVIFGAPPAPAGTTYIIAGGTVIPNFTVNASMTLTVNAQLSVRGTTVTNNGAIAGTNGATRLDFAGSGPMTYTGVGTLGTAVAPFGGLGVGTTRVTTVNAPIVTSRVNLFSGGFINSNLITLGNGGSSSTIVQISASRDVLTGGSFDVSPVHNQGTGGQQVLYSQEANLRTTGVEINPTRTLSLLFNDNPYNVQISGGNVTVTSILQLFRGRFITGSNTIALAASAGVSRTLGYVDGNLRKTFGAAGTKAFEVGTVASGYSPVTFNVTAGTFPTDITVKANGGPAPGLTPAVSLSRYWTLTVPPGAGVTADLTFNYLAADVPATADEAAFKVLRKDGGIFTNVGGTVTPATHTATATGISTFSDWTLGDFAYAAPTATVSGDAAICAGGSAQITATLTGTGPWDITWSDGLVQNGVATSPATRSVSPGSTTVYTITSVSDSVGAGAAFGSATITVNGIPPAPTISTASSIPAGGTGTASVVDHAGSTFNWTVTGGAITAGQGTSAIEFTPNAAGTRITLSVIETSNFGCASPAATSRTLADFLDVPPSNPLHDFIVTLALNGITGGCGGGNYCPGNPVLRSQMAIFLLRGEHGEAYAPPTATGIFSDVPTPSIFADFIEQLFNEGITGGCGSNPPRYCPNDSVLRSQMAVFLLRAEHGSAFAPPPATGIFSDVPVPSFFADFIETLYAEGITGGCGSNPLRYCPNDPTTRGAMAVFLVRTFNLQ